jgi:hypothetical protein
MINLKISSDGSFHSKIPINSMQVLASQRYFELVRIDEKQINLAR